jgi:hypothetical protein
MSTYWVAFDLDQTIGCFESVHPYLTVFFPDVLQIVYRKPYYKGPGVPVFDISTADKKRLASAFGDFVKWMAASEDKNKLLRPGIIPIISLLLKAKKKGIVGGIMIYSNNANPYMLLFAHELIKAVLGIDEPIFCPLVHWWHPLRNKEVRGEKSFDLSHGPKTVDTIRAAFMNGFCKKYYVQVSSADILFFDDLIHKDISNIIPAQNYFHVMPYHRIGDFNVTHNAFLNALMVHDLDKSAGVLIEYKKVGLNIGPGPEELVTFKAQIPDKKGVEVADSDAILRRLAKLLKLDMHYNMAVPKKIVLAVPSERPFEKPKAVVYEPVAVTRYSKRGGGSKRRTRKSVTVTKLTSST